MLTHDERESLAPRVKTALLLHGALFVLVLVLAGISFLSGSGRPAPAAEEEDRLTPVLMGAVAFVDVVLAFGLFAFWTSPTIFARTPALLLAGYRWVTAVVVRDALFAAVAFQGMVLAFVKKSPVFALPFAGASVLLFLVFWPTSGALERKIVRGRELKERGGSEDSGPIAHKSG